MDLAEKINNGNFKFMHIHIYDNTNGNQIAHSWFTPRQVEISDKKIIHGDNWYSEIDIEICDDISYDEYYDSYEYSLNGNNYLIMFF